MATIADLQNAFGQVQTQLQRQMFGQPDDVRTAWGGLVFKALGIANADWSGLPASGSYNGVVPLLTGAATRLQGATTAAALRTAIPDADSALDALKALLGL